MENLASCITNKKTVLFSDHNHKIESFVNYVTNKLRESHPYFFIISNKRYCYHKGQKYSTPYERVTDFEFNFDTVDLFLVCCNKINEAIEQMHTKGNIFIVIDLSSHYFFRKNGSLILDQINKFLLIRDITLIICFNNLAHNIDMKPYDNMIMDVFYHPIYGKSQYNYFTNFYNVTLETFQKIMHDDYQNMRLFYLLDRKKCAYRFTISYNLKETSKYKIKNIVSNDFYKSIKKLNCQPTKRMLKKWKNLPKPVFASSEDELMDGFRFS